MRKKKLIVVWLAAVFAVASWSGAETFRLEYKPVPEGWEKLGEGAYLRPEAGKPDGVGNEPAYNAEPLYFSFPFGADGKEKPYTLVLDKSSAEVPAYDVLYVDIDCDGDICEEKPIPLGKSGAEFELTVTAGGKPLKHQLRARLRKRFGVGIVVSNKGTWQGKITLPGRQMNIALRDRGCNGIYNEPLKLSFLDGRQPCGLGDGFRSKPIEKPLDVGNDEHLCPAIIEAGGKLYDVTVAADGSSISFEPIKGAVGTLETSTDDMAVILITADGHSLAGTAKGRKHLVPVGKVRLFQYGFVKGDADGVEWIMFCMALRKPKDDNGVIISVEEGKVTRLVPGPPVRVSVHSNRGGKVPAGTTVRVGPRFRDAAGYRVSIVQAADKEGRVRHGDVFIIVKHDGKVVTSGTCKWGRGGCGYMYGRYALSILGDLRTCFKSPFGRGAEGEGGMDHTANSGGFLPNNPHPNPLPEGEGTRIGNFKTRSEGRTHRDPGGPHRAVQGRSRTADYRNRRA